MLWETLTDNHAMHVGRDRHGPIDKNVVRCSRQPTHTAAAALNSLSEELGQDQGLSVIG